MTARAQLLIAALMLAAYAADAAWIKPRNRHADFVSRLGERSLQTGMHVQHGPARIRARTSRCMPAPAAIRVAASLSKPKRMPHKCHHTTFIGTTTANLAFTGQKQDSASGSTLKAMTFVFTRMGCGARINCAEPSRLSITRCSALSFMRGE